MSLTGIDSTYFKADLFLPNKGSSGVIDQIDSFIAIYEKDYIYKLLGPSLGDAFISGITATTVDPKWATLKSKMVDTVNKVSPIISYIYTFIILDRMSITTGTGEAKSKNENSISASSIGRQVDAWNKMVDVNNTIYDFVQADPVSYPGLKFKDDIQFFKYINSFGF